MDWLSTHWAGGGEGGAGGLTEGKEGAVVRGCAGERSVNSATLGTKGETMQASPPTCPMARKRLVIEMNERKLKVIITFKAHGFRKKIDRHLGRQWPLA